MNASRMTRVGAATAIIAILTSLLLLSSANASDCSGPSRAELVQETIYVPECPADETRWPRCRCRDQDGGGQMYVSCCEGFLR